MNKNIKTIKQCTDNIKNLEGQIAQLQQAIKAQESLITLTKENIFVEEINGKTFKLRKSPKSKFYGLEFNVNIDVDTGSFSGTVKILDPALKKKWSSTLLDIAEDTNCYISSKFRNVSKIDEETYSSNSDTISDYNYVVVEMVDAYLDKKLVLVD